MGRIGSGVWVSICFPNNPRLVLSHGSKDGRLRLRGRIVWGVDLLPRELAAPHWKGLNHFNPEELRDAGDSVGTDEVDLTRVSRERLPVRGGGSVESVYRDELLDTLPPIDDATRRRHCVTATDSRGSELRRVLG